MTRHLKIDPTKPLQDQNQAPALKTVAPDILQYMRLRDARAFAYTAWWHNVYLLVRRSNPQSIRFIGQPGCTPKPADCKAKTAQHSFYHSGLGRALDVAGLVCDPTLPEFEKAYGKKHAAVLETWKKFKPHLAEAFDRDGNRARMYINGRYFVDRNPSSPTYGVVMLTPTGLVTAAKAVHGDYDLYGIVPADNPSVNIALTEEHPVSPVNRIDRPDNVPHELRVPNCRGRKFTDVQNMLNRRMGVTMVLHGSQEKFSTDTDDELDVFFPDGERSMSLTGSSEIKAFYARELRGRKLMSANPSSPNFGKPYFGKWRVLM